MREHQLTAIVVSAAAAVALAVVAGVPFLRLLPLVLLLGCPLALLLALRLAEIVEELGVEHQPSDEPTPNLPPERGAGFPFRGQVRTG